MKNTKKLYLAVTVSACTKKQFNKFMGYTAKDLPEEDDKQKGFMFRHDSEVGNHPKEQGYFTWAPEDALVNATVVSSAHLAVLQDKRLYNQLSPLKKRELSRQINSMIGDDNGQDSD